MDTHKKSKSNVLIVDEAASTTQNIISLLQTRGFNVGIAQSGRHVIHLLKNNADDIIITNFSMPDLDGHQMLEHIKLFYRNYKVMVVTEDTVKKEIMLQHGLLKAFDSTLPLDQLIDALSVQLDERRKTKRYKISSRLNCTLTNIITHATWSGEILDVSLDGILVRTQEQSIPYLRVTVTIPLPQHADTLYKVQGHIVHTFPAQNRGEFFNAIYFNDTRELTLIEQLLPCLHPDDLR